MKYACTFLLLALSGSCAPSANQVTKAAGVYTEVGSTNTIIIDQQNYYLGPKSTPAKSNTLAIYGLPIARLSSKNIQCEALGSFTFAVSRRSNFVCNGVSFYKVSEGGPRGAEFLAVCGTFTRTGSCAQKTKGMPALSYRFTYIPSKGVEIIEISPKNGVKGSIFKHENGLYILAPL